MGPGVLTYALGKNYFLASRTGLEHHQIEDLLKSSFIPILVKNSQKKGPPKGPLSYVLLKADDYIMPPIPPIPPIPPMPGAL